jgi:hypothetical protein
MKVKDGTEVEDLNRIVAVLNKAFNSIEKTLKNINIDCQFCKCDGEEDYESVNEDDLLESMRKVRDITISYNKDDKN